MTTIADLASKVAELPTRGTIIPYPGTGYTLGNIERVYDLKDMGELIVDLFEGLTTGGADADDGGLSLKTYVTPGVGTDQTAGIQACIDDAIAGGYSHVKPTFSIHPMEISDAVEFGAMEYRAFGDEQAGSGFLCTTSNAQVRFADTDAAYQGTWSGGFRVDGGGVAEVPMMVGVKIIGMFTNITIVGADGTLSDWEDGASLWLKGTQNCTFINIQSAQGMVACRVDGGADTNLFLQCHWNLATHVMVDFCSITTIPGLFGVTGFNVFDTNIFEHNVDSMIRFVWHRSGSWNIIRDSVIALTTASTSSVDYAVYASSEYGGASAFSFLVLKGNQFVCTPASTTKKAVFAHATGQIDVQAGNVFFSWNYALAGNCIISGEQTFFTMHTAFLDETTDFPFVPNEVVTWGKFFRRPLSTSIIANYYVGAESFPRKIELANGQILEGDGTVTPATQTFLESNGVKRFTGTWKVDTDIYARRNASSQVLLTSASGAPAVVFGTPLTTYLYADPTNKVLKQAPGNLFMPGQLTTTQRNALTPAEGWVVWDLTLHKLVSYNGTNWIDGAGTIV